jgi:proteasome lid subunit RPN8/RPN11
LKLNLSADLRTLLERWAHAEYPNEACGLLIGERRNGCVVITRVVQTRNLHREHSSKRYEIAPRDFLAADAEARRVGQDVLGVWHSHPDHPARPSEADRTAGWPDLSYVILSVTSSGVEEVRSWRFSTDGSFGEEEVLQT